VGKPEGKRPLGRSGSMYKDNKNNTDLREWFDFAKNGDQ
jgi:hypothetical protein